MKATVFYSWQSDTKPGAANRTLIERALEAALEEIKGEASYVVDPVVDRDTKGIAGSPDIGLTIFKKIEACSVFVADVTIINPRARSRPMPNPNVLVELGYALKALGSQRIILVQNTAFGGTDQLPFDLRQKRVLRYLSKPKATNRSDDRRLLQAQLRHALSAILDVPQSHSSSYPATLALSHRVEEETAERHDYALRIALTNAGTRTIKEWHIDVDTPTALLDPAFYLHGAPTSKVMPFMMKTTPHGSINLPVDFFRVAGRSGHHRAILRTTAASHAGEIRPRDTKTLTLYYRMDQQTHDLPGILDEQIIVEAYVHGELAAEAQQSVIALQRY